MKLTVTKNQKPRPKTLKVESQPNKSKLKVHQKNKKNKNNKKNKRNKMKRIPIAPSHNQKTNPRISKKNQSKIYIFKTLLYKYQVNDLYITFEFLINCSFLFENRK